MTYKLPTRSLRLLEELFQDRQKADFFVEDIEKGFQESEDILKTKIETSLKEDIHELRNEMKQIEASLKEDIQELRNDFVSLKADFKILDHELRAEMKNLDNSLRAEMKNLDNSLRAEMKNLDNKIDNLRFLLLWLIGLAVLFGTALNPTFISFIKFILVKLI